MVHLQRNTETSYIKQPVNFLQKDKPQNYRICFTNKSKFYSTLLLFNLYKQVVLNSVKHRCYTYMHDISVHCQLCLEQTYVNMALKGLLLKLNVS